MDGIALRGYEAIAYPEPSVCVYAMFAGPDHADGVNPNAAAKSS
jgi:hypothetical protein